MPAGVRRVLVGLIVRMGKGPRVLLLTCRRRVAPHRRLYRRRVVAVRLASIGNVSAVRRGGTALRGQRRRRGRSTCAPSVSRTHSRRRRRRRRGAPGRPRIRRSGFLRHGRVRPRGLSADRLRRCRAGRAGSLANRGALGGDGDRSFRRGGGGRCDVFRRDRGKRRAVASALRRHRIGPCGGDGRRHGGAEAETEAAAEHASVSRARSSEKLPHNEQYSDVARRRMAALGGAATQRGEVGPPS